MKFLVLLCLVAYVAADSDSYYDNYKYPYGPPRYYGKDDGGYSSDYYKPAPYGKHNYRYNYDIYYPWERASQSKYESNYGGRTRGGYYVKLPYSKVNVDYDIKHGGQGYPKKPWW
ncbi:uncharacterized protein LOC119095917 [Pollicipes pollicipes]|uniref:uncharacterized protein LOC119095441 n=1 Tax=Pollicipes pollicipes TaxID=41117 RepID=UPI001884D49D|nr:uncharacterized protein LOC119095441 [Pollicipes pollicipes]XP_037074665.1 uncharacterized protein LOC119095917 [Pollicipes pollicipes]